MKRLILLAMSLLSGILLQAQSNYNLYGMMYRGGQYGAGIIFQLNPTSNVFTKLYDFVGSEGGFPHGSLTFVGNKLYGLTTYGGANGSGTIFEWDLKTNTYTKKADLTGVAGLSGTLVLLGSKLYGVSAISGNDASIIFEYDPNANILTNKFFLYGQNGWAALGSLVAKDGKLYGMTKRGGANNNGVIFEWDPASNVYIKKIDLTYSGGAGPEGTLALLNNKFYGMTGGGGSEGSGVIFEWDPASNVYTKKIDLTYSGGAFPRGSLTLMGGKFYGMTAGGGLSQGGVIFEWDPFTNIYTKKFDLASMSEPSGSLTFFDNKFYGMTFYGGAGVVLFEWNPSTNMFKGMNGFDDIYEDSPSGNDLVVVSQVTPVSDGIPGSCTSFPPVTINSGNNNQWVSITDNLGYSVAEIKANGNNLGTVNTSMFINNGAVREDGTGRLYLDRTITIKPQFPQSSPVDVRLYIKGSEFLALKNAVNSFGQSPVISSIDNIGIFQPDGGCSPVVTSVAHLKNTTRASWQLDYVLSASINYLSTFCFASKNPCSPPVITQLSANPTTLWPADHQMKNITVDYLAVGNCGPVTSALTVRSNEPITGTDAGDISPDWLIVDDHHVQLRAERLTGGTGRIYTITVTSKNAFGTTCKKATQVRVPYQLAGSLSKGFNRVNETDDHYFDYRVLPNPSTNYFEMQVRSSSAEKIELRVFDMSGRLITKLNTTKDKITRFGEDLRPGMYMVKVIQGQHEGTIKIVKQ